MFLNKTYFFVGQLLSVWKRFSEVYGHVIGGSPGHLLSASYVPTLLTKEQKIEVIKLSGVRKD